jgi:4-amino-4-deoxy-L-arabinose transferase-like glycosyltransferase
VRLPFILLFALSQGLMYRIGCLVADRRAGFWAVVALNLSPVFGVTTGTWVLPDGPLDAALLGAALCLLRALADGPDGAPDGVPDGASGGASGGTPNGTPNGTPASAPDAHRRGRRSGLGWWVGAGMCAGLALFSKYTAVLTIGGAGLYLVFSPRDRVWLARPGPYMAAVLALAVFSPVPLWNAAHGWASFAFQGDRAVGLRFQPWMPLTVLGGEALFVLPWIWVPMMLLWVDAFRRGAPWTHRLLAWLAAPPIVAFALISAWSGQRILFHWAAPGYLMLFPLLGQAIGGAVAARWVRRTIAATGCLVVAVVAVISTQMQLDWLGGAAASVLRKDPTDEGLDWTSVRDDLRARGLLRDGAVVAVMNWRDGGKFGYALGPGVTVLVLDRDSRQFGFAHPLAAFAGTDMLVLSVDPPERALAAAARWFDGVSVLPGASVRLDGRVLRPVTVLWGRGLRQDPVARVR